MVNKNIISFSEHEYFWETQVVSKKYRIFKCNFSGETVSVITFFNFLDNSCFWGFYLTKSGLLNKWGNWINSELKAISTAKSFGHKKLFCETLATNTVVVELHKRCGFKLSEKQENPKLILMELNL